MIYSLQRPKTLQAQNPAGHRLLAMTPAQVYSGLGSSGSYGTNPSDTSSRRLAGSSPSGLPPFPAPSSRTL